MYTPPTTRLLLLNLRTNGEAFIELLTKTGSTPIYLLELLNRLRSQGTIVAEHRPDYVTIYCLRAMAVSA